MRVLVVLAALALAATAAAATAAPSVRVSPATVKPGGLLTVVATGWRPGSKVVLAIGPPRSEADPVATATANRYGVVRRAIRLYARALPGPYVLLACQRACLVKASARFTITR